MHSISISLSISAASSASSGPALPLPGGLPGGCPAGGPSAPGRPLPFLPSLSLLFPPLPSSLPPPPCFCSIFAPPPRVISRKGMESGVGNAHPITTWLFPVDTGSSRQHTIAEQARFGPGGLQARLPGRLCYRTTATITYRLLSIVFLALG